MSAIFFLFAGISALAASEGMPNMPIIKPSKIYSVPNPEAGEELLEQRGFGEQEPSVKMMNLMMVEGSGYEGMDMNQMADAKTPPPSNHSMAGAKLAKNDVPSKVPTKRFSVVSKLSPELPKVGTNILEFSVIDENTGKPAPRLVIQSEVAMTSMDMGTETPKVRDLGAGKYRVKVAFTMRGPWAVKLILPGGQEEIISINAGK